MGVYGVGLAEESGVVVAHGFDLANKAHKAVCVTTDPALRRMLRRTLNAVGSSVEFVDSSEEVDGSAQILFIDRQTRLQTELPALLQIVGEQGRVVILGDSIEDSEVVDLLRIRQLDHLITDWDGLDESELVVTSVKLLEGDIFGIEKYLAWGAKVYELEVDSYERKHDALLTIAQQAKLVGARRVVAQKIRSVADELLMNAIYDAPALADDPTRTPYARERFATPVSGHAFVRYACDGRYFAVAVQDDFGRLQKEVILDHLQRARAERGRPQRDGRPGAGAGLGLYFILSSATRFIANIAPGKRTEVICLFDLKQRPRDIESCARSLHIFHADDAASPHHQTLLSISP